ncbi:MAG: hypothetical protein Q9218_006557 [Villophora microphyllina]
MSQIPGSIIYTGAWINWSHGRLLGSTITLLDGHGALLTAFLAIFVTAAGSACWQILSYSMYQRRATHQYRDALHHQVQAIFRNTGTSAIAAWQAVQLHWYWRKQGNTPLARTLPVFVLALLNLLFFGLAGIFSSQVTKAAGNEVLINSPHCGFPVPPREATPSAAFDLLQLAETLTATTYSQACYGKAKDKLQCNQFVRPSLSSTSIRNATCPFSPNLCWYGATGAYAIDSGLLDSFHVLGINAPTSQRIQYRKLTTCSPIHMKDYHDVLNDTDPSQIAYGDTLININLGEIVGVSNYTFRYNLHTFVDNIGYQLTSFLAIAGSPTNSWVPVPALNRTDGDITLALLTANSIVYEEPVADPFYSASNSTPMAEDDGTNASYYSPDYDVTAIACMDQHQFCNPVNHKCTQLTGSNMFTQNNAQFLPLKFNRAQYLTAEQISAIMLSLTTHVGLHARGANALRASETVHNSFFQIGLPDTQWMIEVSSWFDVAMAKLQAKMVQYATGPTNVPAGYSVIKLPSDASLDICKNQIIRNNSGTTSFSVLGVAIILIVGSLLIVTSLVLEPALGFARRQMRRNEYKSLQYIADGTWQLQRLAYEEAGQGHWSGGANTVPLTRKGDTMGLPRNADVKHPRLGRCGHVTTSDPSIPEADSLIVTGKGG